MSADASLLQAIVDADEPRALAALDAGALPEAFDSSARLDALALATSENLPSVVRALLAAGASVDVASSACAHERGELDLVTATWKWPSSVDGAVLLRGTWTAARGSIELSPNAWLGQRTVEAELGSLVVR